MDGAEIAVFVNARLDEEEAAAKAALWAEDSAEWRALQRDPVKSDGRWVVIDSHGEGVTTVRPQAADDEGVARHIARHDPARVLRGVKATRVVLGAYETAAGMLGTLHAVTRANLGIVRAHAVIWENHPDFRPEWRP